MALRDPALTLNAAGVEIVNQMIGGTPRRASPMLDRMWQALYAGSGDRCPVSGAQQLGEAVIALIESRELRRRLRVFRIAREYEIATLGWIDGRVSRFHPDGVEQRIAKHAVTHTGAIGRATFAEVALTLAQHDEPAHVRVRVNRRAVPAGRGA